MRIPSSYIFFSFNWLSLLLLLSSCKTQDTPMPVEDTDRISKVVWSDHDFQQYTYLTDGKLTQYISQWVYINDDSNATQKVIADFTYHSTGNLEKVIFNSGFFNNYYFENAVLKKTEEYDNKNRLRLMHTYTFDSKGKLTEVLTQVHDLVEGEANQIMQTYMYDTRGNLTEQKVFNKLPGQETFALSAITRYEAYDDKKSVDNLTVIFPYLPGTTLHVNNPGKRTVFGPDGSTIISVQTYTYTYNEKGYPVQKTVYTGSEPQAGPLTASYEYE